MKMSPGELDKVPLEDGLRREVERAQRITQRVARKREIQFVAKLLRDIDTEPLLEAIAAIDSPGIEETRKLHRLEGWRNALLTSDESLYSLRSSHPNADLNALRQLVRNARKEQAREGVPHKFARQLFRALRALDDESTLSELDGD